MLERIAEKFDCLEGTRLRPEPNVECLRKIDPQELIDANILPVTDIRDGYVLSIAHPWPPIVDGTIVKNQIYDDLMNPEKYEKLPPILTGSAKEEGEVVASV